MTIKYVGRTRKEYISILDKLPCSFTSKQASEIGVSRGELGKLKYRGLIKHISGKNETGTGGYYEKTECILQRGPVVGLKRKKIKQHRKGKY